MAPPRMSPVVKWSPQDMPGQQWQCEKAHEVAKDISDINKDCILEFNKRTSQLTFCIWLQMENSSEQRR